MISFEDYQNDTKEIVDHAAAVIEGLTRDLKSARMLLIAAAASAPGCEIEIHDRELSMAYDLRYDVWRDEENSCLRIRIRKE